jgi:hypothetical protein
MAPRFSLCCRGELRRCLPAVKICSGSNGAHLLGCGADVSGPALGRKPLTSGSSSSKMLARVFCITPPRLLC